MDSGIDKKKRRLAALKNQKETDKAQESKSILGVADCDIGASPVMNKRSILNKGEKWSPIRQHVSIREKLGKRR